MDQSTIAGYQLPELRKVTTLTAAQVWYVAHVYPERVSEHEARPPYELAVLSDDDRSYWEAAAKVLTELAIHHADTHPVDTEPELLQALIGLKEAVDVIATEQCESGEAELIEWWNCHTGAGWQAAVKADKAIARAESRSR